jgi:hypothetical protein
MRLLPSRLQGRERLLEIITLGHHTGTVCCQKNWLGHSTTLTNFDERGAATFAHLASVETIAQLFGQVYYVNKYATTFLEQGVGVE